MIIRFQSLYQRFLIELTLRGKSPKTIDLYTRCLRQVSDYFDTCPTSLAPISSSCRFHRRPRVPRMFLLWECLSMIIWNLEPAIAGHLRYLARAALPHGLINVLGVIARHPFIELEDDPVEAVVGASVHGEKGRRWRIWLRPLEDSGSPFRRMGCIRAGVCLCRAIPFAQNAAASGQGETGGYGNCRGVLQDLHCPSSSFDVDRMLSSRFGSFRSMSKLVIAH